MKPYMYIYIYILKLLIKINDNNGKHDLSANGVWTSKKWWIHLQWMEFTCCFGLSENDVSRSNTSFDGETMIHVSFRYNALRQAHIWIYANTYSSLWPVSLFHHFNSSYHSSIFIFILVIFIIRKLFAILADLVILIILIISYHSYQSDRSCDSLS